MYYGVHTLNSLSSEFQSMLTFFRLGLSSSNCNALCVSEQPNYFSHLLLKLRNGSTYRYEMYHYVPVIIAYVLNFFIKNS